MKAKIKILSILVLTISLFSFKSKNIINKCYVSFEVASNLSAAKPERLPKDSQTNRMVKTANGAVEISRIDGYRVLYYNTKNVPFVNLKVELSEQNAYESDQKKLLENLNYLNTHSLNKESNELIELNFNGYKIVGLSRSSIETGAFLGTFIMFPGDGVTVYFYFNNLKAEYRNFEDLEGYKMQRDLFLNEYTKHLRSCIRK